MGRSAARIRAQADDDPARAIATVFAERPTRREGDRELPLGPKATRTRATILEAASATFASAGYLHTSVGDIAERAGVSLGTVYQYFRDRSDVVAALVQINVGSMLERTDVVWHAEDGPDGLRRIIENFVAAYIATAPMAGVWEEVCFVEPELASLRRSLGQLFTGAVEREFRRAAGKGLVAGDLDPALAARALTGMVDRYCYVTYVFDPPATGAPSAEESAAVLTRIWAGGVGLV
ncbi:MAG: hypothetical protein NVS3B12_19330 [Acidimicrobiales bacterium]